MIDKMKETVESLSDRLRKIEEETNYWRNTSAINENIIKSCCRRIEALEKSIKND